MRQKKSFTLIEVLLVTSLFASIALAVFTCLANGLKLWDRSRMLVLEEDGSIFFDKFASDLRNTFSFSTLSWEGEEYAIAFPTVVLTKADRASSRAREEYVEQLGRVRYSFDFSRGNLVRQQANYSQGLHAEWSEPQVLASGMKEVRFKYFFPGAKDYQLHVDQGGELPSGVEIEIHFGEGEAEKVLKRFIAIPLGT